MQTNKTPTDWTIFIAFMRSSTFKQNFYTEFGRQNNVEKTIIDLELFLNFSQITSVILRI